MAASDYAVTTYSYVVTHTAEQCMSALADQGFNAFELVMYPGHAWPADMDSGKRRQLGAFLYDRSLTLRSLNQPNIDLNIAAATREMRDYSISSLCKTVELAGDLCVPDVVIGPGKLNPLVPIPHEEAVGHLYRALDVLVPLSKKIGTRVLVENMPFGFVPDAESLMMTIEAYGPEEVGVLYDVANGAFIRENVRAALQRCGSRLKMIHLSDTGLSVYKHDPIGCGTIDFNAVMDDLASIGWTERPVLEMVGMTSDPAAEFFDSTRILDGAGGAGRFTH
jgi:L-ribulose-5-phosphate 3-epimerase